MLESQSHLSQLPHLTIGEIERNYGIPYATTYLWVITGKLPWAKEPGTYTNPYQIPRLDFELFLLSPQAGKHQRMPQILKINSIVVRTGLQLRDKTSPKIVADYAAAISRGAVFPPILAARIDGVITVIDGFHRMAAHIRANKDSIRAYVIDNVTMSEAMHLAATANLTNGLHLTTKDRMKAARALIDQPEFSKLSLREIGRRVGISHTQVKRLRRELEGKTQKPPVQPPQQPEQSICDDIKQGLIRAISAWGKFEPDNAGKLLAIVETASPAAACGKGNTPADAVLAPSSDAAFAGTNSSKQIATQN